MCIRLPNGSKSFGNGKETKEKAGEAKFQTAGAKDEKSFSRFTVELESWHWPVGNIRW